MAPRSLGTRAVGIGELSLAVAAARGNDRAGVSRTLHAALEAGIELVDVAAETDAERMLGEAIRGLRLRDTAIAAARVPAAVARGTPVGDTLAHRLPLRYVQRRVEDALRATKLDALPLAQVELRAAWRSAPEWPELVGTCARLVREGKVLAWGALVERIEDDTAELVSEPWLDAISVPLSLCERAALPLLSAARESVNVPPPDAQATATDHMRAAGLTPELALTAGMPADLVLAAATTLDDAARTPTPRAPRTEPPGILARRPLGGGALAGTLGPGVKLKPRDDRNALAPDDLARVAVAVAKLARFVKQIPPAANTTASAKEQLEQSLRERQDEIECQTVAELALRYAITRGALALPRLHRHEHVIDAFAASMLPALPSALIDQLEHLDI